MSSISSTFKLKVLQLYSSEQYFCYIQVSSITYSYIQVSSITAIFKLAVLQLYSSQQYYSYIQASSITAIFKSAVLQLYSSQQYYSYIQVSSNSANPIFKTAVLVIFKSAVLVTSAKCWRPSTIWRFMSNYFVIVFVTRTSLQAIHHSRI